ncbi:hypothetical protein QBC35DRAFT_507094 [Podospora australis]|uniref:Integral membrane protein n=1 Tax=Podospora australis TaxID=1536484 RepID=A0AAN6WM58_9PEZI|nr:hypothetical protein QBC35DRAFT_507094 [Podospora australis]
MDSKMQQNPPDPNPSTTTTTTTTLNNNVDDGGAYFGVQPGPVQQSSATATASDLPKSTPLTPLTELPPPVPLEQTVAVTPSSTQLPQQQQQPQQPAATPARNVQFRPLDRNTSAIRIRRLRPVPSSLGVSLAPELSHEPLARARTQTQAQDFGQRQGQGQGQNNTAMTGRRRSSSEPQRPWVPRAAGTVPASSGTASGLPAVSEGNDAVPADLEGQVPPAVQSRFRRLGRRRQTVTDLQQQARDEQQDLYDERIVDFLDVVDPEVATLSSITNIQNSLFLPSLGKWVNRRPTYDLSQLPPMPGAFPPSKESIATAADEVKKEGPHMQRSPSLSSVLTSQPQYAILPNDASLEGWNEEEIKLLNDYVRHMLHSRRSKLKQRLKAFGKYARRPVGFLVTLYATLITLFGLAWVLFLIGWIYVGEKQLYVINVIDYVLVALFAVVGDGMIPWRAVDTYHMFFVARYHRKTWKERKKLLLPDLRDHNDLPTGHHNPLGSMADLEAQQLAAKEEELKNTKDEFIPVLTEKEQKSLIHHQTKLAKSHTFYKPHETETHHAFPLRLLITVVLLLDLHSCLQVSLGAVTFGIPYERRPAAATTTILCCSIFTNLLAGVLISVGDRRTRKKDVLERLMRQEMTAEMMKKIAKKKEKEKEEEEGGKTSLMEGLSLPWVDKDRASRASSEGKPSRSLSLPRGGNKPKGADKVGRFSSDVPSRARSVPMAVEKKDDDSQKMVSGSNQKDTAEKTGSASGNEKLRIPGAFVEEE